MGKREHMWLSSKACDGQLSISAEKLHRPTNARPSTEAPAPASAADRLKRARERCCPSSARSQTLLIVSARPRC
jgi:hypothetical protein